MDPSAQRLHRPVRASGSAVRVPAAVASIHRLGRHRPPVPYRSARPATIYFGQQGSTCYSRIARLADHRPPANDAGDPHAATDAPIPPLLRNRPCPRSAPMSEPPGRFIFRCYFRPDPQAICHLIAHHLSCEEPHGPGLPGRETAEATSPAGGGSGRAPRVSRTPGFSRWGEGSA